jgi:hypothetical protein
VSDEFTIYADILARLPPLRRHKTGYSFRCPFGDRHRSGVDKNPSATVWVGRTGQLLVGCFGCKASFEEFVELTGVPAHQWFPDRAKFSDLAAARLDVTPKKVASYEYADVDGRWVGTKTKLVPGWHGKSKTFVWDWRDGVKDENCPLYLLPELVAADRDAPVFVPEGEKCVHAVRRLGFAATCAPHGGNQWLPSHSHQLAGRWVVILPDNDRHGNEYADRLGGALLGHAAKVSLARAGRDGYDPPPDGGDVADWLKLVPDPRAALRLLLHTLPAYARQTGGFFA